jgi:hypothetical protein
MMGSGRASGDANQMRSNPAEVFSTYGLTPLRFKVTLSVAKVQAPPFSSALAADTKRLELITTALRTTNNLFIGKVSYNFLLKSIKIIELIQHT